jgi:hypothetical protein
MAPTPHSYSGEGPRITVNAMIKDPLLIRARMLSMLNQQFIMETLLRKAPAAEAGVLLYNESTPLFTDDDAAVIAEAAEIPLVQGQDGIPKAAFTIKTGLGVEITIEMKNRNRIDQVTTRMTQVRNTIVRHWERRLFAALQAAVPAANVLDLGPTAATDSWWTGSAPKIRTNVLDAAQLVREAQVPGQDSSFLGFEPDTIVLSTRSMTEIMKDDEFRKIYEGSPLAEENPFYSGQADKKAMGFTWVPTRFMGDDDVYVLESKTVGGYTDERPLNTSPTYEDKDREVWRANTVRQTGIFIDQPFAVARIKNIKDA